MDASSVFPFECRTHGATQEQIQSFRKDRPYGPGHDIINGHVPVKTIQGEIPPIKLQTAKDDGHRRRNLS